MLFPAAITNQANVNTAISELVREMSPDVVRIRFNFDEDWSGDPAIFFRVLLSDEAAEERLHEVARKVRALLDEHLSSLDLLLYYNFRSVSEQAEMLEEAWS